MCDAKSKAARGCMALEACNCIVSSFVVGSFAIFWADFVDLSSHNLIKGQTKRHHEVLILNHST